MALTPTELEVLDRMLSSDGYAVFDDWIAEQQQLLRDKLERMGTSHDESNHIRGRLYTLASMRRDEALRNFRHAQEVGPDA